MKKKPATALSSVLDTFFENVLESLEDYAVFTMDTKGFIQSWNAGAERILQYKHKEVLGKHFKMFFLPEDQEIGKPEKELEIALRLGKAGDAGCRVRKDKTTFWASGKVFPLRNKENKLLGFTKVLRDKSQEKLVQEKLEESKFYFQHLIDSVPHMIWIEDEKGETEYMNKLGKEITQLSLDEINEGQWKKLLHPNDLERITKEMKVSFKKHVPYTFEYRMRNKNGDYSWFLETARPIEDKGKLHWIATSTNIDAQKKIEEQKSDFLAVVTHELKTPITSLKAFAQILEQRFIVKNDMESAHLLSKMDAQLRKLQVIISDLLDITKMESGKLRFDPQTFNVYELVSEIFEEMGRIAPEHTFVMKGEKDVTLFADRDKVGQLLTNLLMNAVKYSSLNKRITVRFAEKAGRAMISVEDYGIGISKALQKNIFTRFYRVPGKKSETFPGLGLGLYIVKQIVELHNGTIRVQSARGKGSTFYIELPSQLPVKNKKK